MTSLHSDAAPSWEPRRFSIPLAGDFDDVVRCFESLIPIVPEGYFESHVTRHSSWSEVVIGTQRLAPGGLLILWRADVGPFMALAGNDARATAYLVGNPVVSERMFRYDERAANYSALLIELTQRRGGPVTLTVDQPSTRFEHLDSAPILKAGRELDLMLAEVVRLLGAEVPTTLAADQ